MKNILLLSLSPVTMRDGKPVEVEYKDLGDEKNQTTNESAFRHLLNKKVSLDKIFILPQKEFASRFPATRKLTWNFSLSD